MEKCSICGAPLEENRCSYCGNRAGQAKTEMSKESQDNASEWVQPQIVVNTVQVSPGFIPYQSKKSKATALLLCLFLGTLGAHKFYVGKIGAGIVYLLTLGLFGIGWVIDILLIACGVFKDSFGLPLKQ